MKTTLFLAALCGLAATAYAAGDAPAAPSSTMSSGIDTGNFDWRHRPQDDFYRWVSGRWLETTQIPPDKSNYGSFVILQDEAEQHLREIIEEAATQKDRQPGSDAQKIGDFYASFMDEARLEKLGDKPLQAEFAHIEKLTDARQIPALMAHLNTIGVRSPFVAFIGQDDKDSTRYIVYLTQSGLGLPDRDYYLSDDKKFVDLRAKYLAHIERMWKLAGGSKPEQTAKDIVALEIRLAGKQWTKVEERDAEKTYNKYEVAKLGTLSPKFDWIAYLAMLGAPDQHELVVREPTYFEALDPIVAGTSPAVWRAYFKWRVLSEFAPYLSKKFVDENFAFYGTALRGVPQNRPRWKRGVAAVEDALGEALGRLYVAKYFPPQAKARMEQLVQNLELAFKDGLSQLDWMSPETRQAAQAKLARFTPKIGYPDKWKDYSALEVRTDDLAGNVVRAAQWQTNYDLHKLGKPVDRAEWFMTPQTVNAYYNPSMNEIVFPAAILQPSFFDMTADDAVNYGAIGAVIGHEMGHGFDDQGSKYDGDGNLRNWWTDADRANYEKRVKALIGQYDRFSPLPDFHVNGALTIGENIGDLTGVTMAYRAYKLSLHGQEAPVIGGFTGDQRFFIGWAQIWRRLMRDEERINRLKVDPHSPEEFRCNGVLMNVPEFYAAFNVKLGDQMYRPPDQRVKIW